MAATPSNPFNPGYYDTAELREFGFASVGNNVRIARNCTIIGLGNIRIGNNVRIDGYTTIACHSGHCDVGSYIHIGGGCHLACGGGLEMEDFSGISQGVRIYTVSDDYSGNSLTNPTVPAEYLNVCSAEVKLERHVIVGSGSVILPGVTIGEGSSVGALSLVTRSLDPWGVYSGVPARRLKERSQALLTAERKLLSENEAGKSS